jgi:hypothetical protein
MSAAMSVPPSTGLSTPELPVEDGKPVGQPTPIAWGASDAVVAHLTWRMLSSTRAVTVARRARACLAAW